MPSQDPDVVLEQLQPIFRNVLNDPALSVTRESSALNTPGWDSLGHIELIAAVERRFRVRFGLGEVQDLKNVGELVDLVRKKTA